MTDTTITTGQVPPAAEPDGAPRIATLDILRGVAILGILFMNINDMGASFSDPDLRHMGWTIYDQIAWWAREILANGTARTMLQFLFGAGMVILTDRIATAAGRRIAFRRYYWRNIVLWLFGLAHIFIFLWPGDILHTYGIAALVAFWFCRLPPRWLITIGLIMATMQLFGASYFGIYRPYERRIEVAALTAKRDAGQNLTKAETEKVAKYAKAKAEEAKDDKKHDARVAAEDKARSSTTVNWVREQWRKAVQRLGVGELFSIWDSASMMLIGAALFKMGILQGLRSRSFCIAMTLGYYAIGLSLRAFGAWEQTRFVNANEYNWAFESYARIAATLGHIGLIHLLLGTAIGAKLFRPFIAAGRTALTLYVLQTIVCLWILYPPFAFGLYGQTGWMTMMLISAAIDLALLWAANAYLRYYRIAPVEWAWRSIVERQRLPFRKAR